MNHVLICTEESGLQKQLAAAAQRAGLGTYHAGKAAIALKLMTEHQPALVLLDQSFENPLEAAANLTSLSPKARIILLIREPDFELSRAALRLGIADLMLFPAELDRLDELLTRISHSVATQSSHTLGRSVAFFSVRGGAGATCLAINTAAACTALVPGPVLLIDGHMHTADVSAMLDIKWPRSVADLLPVMDELTAGHIRDVCATHQTGLHVLLAPPDPATGHQLQPEQLARIARVAKRGFAAVIIDCPSPLDDRCAAILEEAGTPVLVSTPEAPSVIAWRRLKHLTGTAIGKTRLAVNQVSTRSEISQADMARLTGLEGLPSVRHDSAALVPLINMGRTLFDLPSGSKRATQKLPAIATDLIRLTQKLLGTAN